jgi:hypothetical protein
MDDIIVIIKAFSKVNPTRFSKLFLMDAKNEAKLNQDKSSGGVT